MQYALRPTVNVYARYSRGYRQPTAEEMSGLFFHGTDFVMFPNPGLEEERSDAFEISAKMKTYAFSAQAAVFHTKYTGFIQTRNTGEHLDPGNPASQEILEVANVAAAEIYGYELFAEQALDAFSPRLEGFAARVGLGQAFGQDTHTGEYLGSVEPFKATAGLIYGASGGRYGGELIGVYRARKDHLPPDTVFVPESSFVVDLAGWWMPSDRLTLRAGVRNLTDAAYHVWSGSTGGVHFPENPGRSTRPGINGYISATLKF